MWNLLIFQVEDVLRLEPVGAGRAGPELVPLLGERVGEAHDAAALDAVALCLAEERGDVARLLGGVGAAAAAAQEEPLVAQLALPTQGALEERHQVSFIGVIQSSLNDVRAIQGFLLALFDS